MNIKLELISVSEEEMYALANFLKRIINDECMLSGMYILAKALDEKEETK